LITPTLSVVPKRVSGILAGATKKIKANAPRHRATEVCREQACVQVIAANRGTRA
jgi:hypothetical protein